MLRHLAVSNSLVCLMQFIILATAISQRETHLDSNLKNGGAVAVGNVVGNEKIETISIRHGRSRVRDQHIWRERRMHLNVNSSNSNSNNINRATPASIENFSVNGNASTKAATKSGKNKNNTTPKSALALTSTSASNDHQESLSSAIPSGNGHLFGSGYWRNSDMNGTIASSQLRLSATNHRYKTENPQTLTPPAVSNPTAPTPLLVTHRIRKLHKKKIMERIRQRVDKSLGVVSSKNHRSLIEAEHLQGRPTDSAVSEDDDDDNSNDGDDDVDNIISNEAVHVEPNMVFNAAAVSGSELGVEAEVPYHLGNELTMLNSQYDDDDDDDYQNDNGDVSNNKDAEISDEADKYLTTTATVVTTNAPEVGAAEIVARNDIIEMEKPTQKSTSTKTKWLLVSKKKIKSTKQISTPPPTDASDDGLEIITTSDKHLLLTSKLRDRQAKIQTLKPFSQATPQIEAATKAFYEIHSSQQSKFDANKVNDDENDAFRSENSSISSNESFDYQGEYALNDETSSSDSSSWSKSSNSNTSAEMDYLQASTAPNSDTTAKDLMLAESHSIGPNQLASTSVGGIGLDRQSVLDIEEMNFDDKSIDSSSMNSEEVGLGDGSHNDLVADIGNSGAGGGDEDSFESNPFLAGVVDAANEDEIYDWDEISRNNRRNLMRGRDVVTKFLQIVETQHMLGSNCEAGTSLNLGEGVVDRYAQERFRVEAEVAVNRANMLTRIFKMTSRAVQSNVNLLHASVLSMVEFDDDIFAAGNCFDWNEHPSQPGLFCPFAYRLPAPNLGAIFAKDLATEYHYLGNTSEWFFQARKNAEKVITRNEQYLKSFHLYSNKTDERIEDDTLAVKYEDGRWSKPYYDCGGGNIWMLTYTVPFFGYENQTYHFKGTSGIDIDLRRVDIDQCPQRNTPGMTQPLNIFAGTDKCKQRTTMCEALKGLGFRRGSYKCVCRKGFFFPDVLTMQKYFNGSLLEEEYEKLMLGRNSTYNVAKEYECLPCAEGCDSCEDGSPCIAALNWPMRTSILVLACTVIGLLPPAAWFTFRYQQVKVVRAASPALLRVIALGAFFIYCTNIVMYPNPNLYTCTARIWMREIGFSLTYGALMLKTWRISVIFRVRSAKAVKITDAALLKRLGCICGVIGTFLLVRTLVSPPDVVVGRTADDLKAFLCKTDWWDYTFTSMEVLFLAWGVRLCIMVRKAPSEFNESRFISMAIYNEFLLTCFLNVSMLFLQSPANPDLLYIIFFCHTQLTVTLLLGLIFGSKVYIVLRSGKSHHETIGMGAKSSGAKFNFRPQVRTFANLSSATTSTAQVMGTNSADTKLSDQEALEEIRQLSMQLQRIQEMAPPKGVAVMTISSLLDGLKTPGGIMMVAAAATHAVNPASNQLQLRQQQQPLLALNTEIEKYNQQLQVPQNNNIGAQIVQAQHNNTEQQKQQQSNTVILNGVDKAINTDIGGKDFKKQLLDVAQLHVICTTCLQSTLELKVEVEGEGDDANKKTSTTTTTKPLPLTACQQLGSPLAEGSLSFANIKLECMCSQSDDLDLIQRQRRRTNVRSAATNTPPSSTHTQRRQRSKSGTRGGVGDEEAMYYQICDNCKKKYTKSKSKKCKSISCSGDSSSKAVKLTRLERSKQQRHATAAAPGIGISQAQSADVLERRQSAARVSHAKAISKKVHSTDDITFCTTTNSNSSSSSSSNHSRSSSTAGDSNEIRSNEGDSDFDEGSKMRLRRRKITPVEHVNAEASTSANATTTAAEVPSLSNASTNSNNSNAADGSASATTANGGSGGGGSNRPKRPEKLMLDLNDRSKYSKEVSV